MTPQRRPADIPGPLPDIPRTNGVPPWMSRLVAETAGLDAALFHRVTGPPTSDTRRAAVLVLFGADSAGPDSRPDLLLLRRASTLDTHPGQVAFPGGAVDPGDDGPVHTALREATEEVGVRPNSVLPMALLPRLHVPVSRFEVTPVVAYWSRPSAVWPVDPAETSAVARVPVSWLADPANRIQLRHPSGFVSPAYLAPGMLVWGFTAALVTLLLSIGGWDFPWNDKAIWDLDAAWHIADEMADGPARVRQNLSADSNVNHYVGVNTTDEAPVDRPGDHIQPAAAEGE